jgi:tRNA (guanine37-N1)-methyltransferase
MFFEILTLFPSMFEGVFSESIIKRALEKKLVSVHIDNIRDYSEDAYKGVDDYPYGGDPGMLIKPEPVARAIDAARSRLSAYAPKVIYCSPHGETLTHAIVDELRQERGLMLLCGHYKGIDHRICEKYVDREISVGDYVLSGGEIAAMIIVDAVTRLIPGALGNCDSASRDSFFSGLLSPPHYTRPEEFEGMRVPEVLLSGHHEKIRTWQLEQAKKITRIRRPDLWEQYCRKHKEKNK